MLSTVTRRAALLGYSKAQVERPHEHRECKQSVSVVIPCHNYGHYLPACVGSALNQQDVEVDVLIIDDASTDGSAEVARTVAAGDSRVRAICHSENMGHIATYNEGLSLASGDYTALLSADDLLTEGSLWRSAQLMRAHPSVGLVYGHPVAFVGDAPGPARTVTSSWTIWQGLDWIADRCKSGRNALRSPEAVMRTSVVREAGAYRADLPHAADFEMWMRAAKVSDVGYLGGVDQAYYRVHPASMSHTVNRSLLTDMSQRILAFENILSECAEILPNVDQMSDMAHRAIAREALSHVIDAYARGSAECEPVDEYAALALKVWPTAGGLREWRAVSHLSSAANISSRQRRSLMAHMAVSDLRYRLLWRRWRWTGV